MNSELALCMGVSLAYSRPLYGTCGIYDWCRCHDGTMIGEWWEGGGLERPLALRDRGQGGREGWVTSPPLTRAPGAGHGSLVDPSDQETPVLVSPITGRCPAGSPPSHHATSNYPTLYHLSQPPSWPNKMGPWRMPDYLQTLSKCCKTLGV